MFQKFLPNLSPILRIIVNKNNAKVKKQHVKSDHHFENYKKTNKSLSYC